MNKLTLILISITVFLVPLFNVPQFFPNSFLPKLALLILLVLSLTLLFTLKIAREEKTEIFSLPLAIPLIFYLAINIVSSLQSSGKYDAFLSLAFLACLIFLYILIPQLVRSQKAIFAILYIITISVSLTGLIPSNSPAFITGLMLLITAPVFLSLLFESLKNIKSRHSLIKIPLAIILALVFIISSAKTLQTLNLSKTADNPAIPAVLDRKIGWIISLETIKNRPFFGVGPSNFINAYTQYKPFYAPNISYPDLNFTPSATSSNEFFLILTTTGALGIIAYLFFLGRAILFLIPKTINNVSNIIVVGLSLSFFIYIILQALIPLPAMISFPVFIFLALGQILINKNSALIIEFPRPKEEDTFPVSVIPFSVALTLSLAILYFVIRCLLGEFYENKALTAAIANDRLNAIGFSQKAIDQNPISDIYHANFAQINYSSAISLLQQKQSSESGGLTDSDKSLAGQFFQKAIDEGKIAVNLNPQKVYNLQTLAAIYAGLSSINTPNAEQFSLDAYQKAVQVDPTNSRIRLELGGIYFGKNEFATASAIFRDAVYLQNNYANAHYFLGNSLLRLGQYDEGLRELQITADLIPEGNADKIQVLKEIEDYKAQIASISANQKSPAAPATPKPTQQPTSKPTPAL